MTEPSLASVDDPFMRFCWFSLPPSARARILSRAAKTTWVFGAGASHHYDLNRFGVPVPLASGFFKAFNELPTSQGFATYELVAEKSAEVEKWKANQREVAEELQQQTAMVGNLRAEQVSSSTEREALNRKLQESQAALQAVQLKYDTLREQNSAQLLRTASLETKINDLTARLKEAASTDDQQQRFLASDRDIRELMGARDLYIADVYDVDPMARHRNLLVAPFTQRTGR